MLQPTWKEGGMMTGVGEVDRVLEVPTGEGADPSTWKPTTL